jgi:hypothetical protein
MRTHLLSSTAHPVRVDSFGFFSCSFRQGITTIGFMLIAQVIAASPTASASPTAPGSPFSDWAALGLWIYVLVAIFFFIYPFFPWSSGWKHPEAVSEDYFKIQNSALEEKDRDKIPVMENSLKELQKVADKWHVRMRELWWIQSYVTVTTIATSTLLAAIATSVQKQRHGPTLLAFMSIHLAITQGLHKAFRVEQILITAKTAPQQYIALCWRTRHDTANALKSFSSDVESLRLKYGELDIANVPTASTEKPA